MYNHTMAAMECVANHKIDTAVEVPHMCTQVVLVQAKRDVIF